MTSENLEHLPDISMADVSPNEISGFVYAFHLWSLLHSMLHYSNYEGKAREGLERDINNMDAMTESKFGLIYTVLENAKAEPVINGRYNQEELLEYQKRFK